VCHGCVKNLSKENENLDTERQQLEADIRSRRTCLEQVRCFESASWLLLVHVKV